ncbi:hypothetical protein ACP4OV_031465 [Aristida adscensionis]
MEVAVERPPPPVKEEKRPDAKPDIAAIGSALPIVFESFQSAQKRDASIKQDDRLEAARAEMGQVREENERLRTKLSRISSDYQLLQMHFLEVVKLHEQAAKARLPEAAATASPAPAPPLGPGADDDLVSLSLGTRSSNAGPRRAGHERSLSSSGTAETAADDEGRLSLGLGFARGGGGRPSADDDKASGASASAAAAPVLNLSSDGSSADDGAKPAQAAACPPTEAARKSPSGGADARDGGADDEVLQQQAKKARVSVRVKCDNPTMNDGCQWRKYGQKISKGNPCPRAYYRCTMAAHCPVRKQVQRCADDTSILITTYEGTHSHDLPPAARAMASATAAAAATLTAGSTSSAASHHGHFPFAPAALLGPATTMVSTATSCPTVTLDLTATAAAKHSLLHSSPYAAAAAAAAAGYESKAVPAAWSSGYLAYGGGGQSPYFAAKSSPALGHLFGGGLGVPRPEQMYGQSYLQRASAIGGAGGHGAVAPAVTDTLAKAIASDPSFQTVLAAAITSAMGRGGGAAAAHK